MRRTIIILLSCIAAGALGGTNIWTTSEPGGAQAWNLSVEPTDPNVLFVQTAAGIYRTNDGGTSWVSANNGLVSTSLNTFVVASGDAWTAVNWGLPGATANSVALSEKQTLTAYASASQGTFRTDDAALSWGRLLSSEGELAASPDTPDTAYLATGSAVLKTADGGKTWKGVSPSAGTRVAVAASDPATLYAVLSNGMWKSTNGGDEAPSTRMRTMAARGG
jgi:photosystem II stability/assembly factor-like uncharacterized protein